jgi:FlaA1/EpsC-like NDP-sugar epimerase
MNLPINNLKLLIKILADVSIVFISLYLAIIINAERLLPLSKSYIALGLIIISLQITILYFFNTYSEFTKFFDYENILKILISLFLTSLFLIIISFFAIDNTKIFFRFLNIKILTLYSGIFIFFNISIKILAKYILFKNQDKSSRNDFKKYIIYGAGRTGVELKKIIQNYGDIEILYFVDDDKNKIGRTIDGIKVLSPKALEKEKKKIDLVLMCMPSASSFEVQDIEKNLSNLSLNNKNISSLDDFLNSDNMKNKKINFNHNTVLDQSFSSELKQKFSNKKVLVTGAGGTIGKELMFQISRLKRTLIIFQMK